VDLNLKRGHSHVDRASITYTPAVHDPSNQEPVESIMGYHNATFLKVYDKLASEFAICDRWFASLPTDTWPNRLYSLTGGSGGAIGTPDTEKVANNFSIPGYSLKTIFEVLQEHGIDWGVFFSDIPFSLIFKGLVQDVETP
jgi:phospholipase C